jgi:uncharacterized protein YlxW (UPF0749 family)
MGRSRTKADLRAEVRRLRGQKRRLAKRIKGLRGVLKDRNSVIVTLGAQLKRAKTEEVSV